MTLGEMLRQERMGAGMADQKDLDAQYARAVMGDGKFEACRFIIERYGWTDKFTTRMISITSTTMLRN